MGIRILILGALMATCCHAAEIFAWSLPLGRYALFGLESRGIARVEAPPEASVFFHPGDELWNLAEAETNGEKPKLDWLVWNATTHRIVAKASWGELARLHELLDGDEPVQQVRIVVDVFNVPADRSAPRADAVPAISASVVCRSAQRFELSRESGGGKVSVSGESYAGTAFLGGKLSPVYDLRIELSAILKGQEELEVATNLRFQDGHPFWVARDHNGTNGIDIRVTCEGILPDGTSLIEVLQWQHKGKSEVFAVENEVVGPLAIAGGLFRSEFHPLSGIQQLADPNMDLPGGSGDPFAVPPQEDPFSDRPAFPEILPPASLSKWIDHPVLDLKTLAGKGGILMEASDFIGYDPFTQRLYIYAAKSDVIEKWDRFLAFLGPCGEYRTLVFTTSGDGESRIAGQSGMKFGVIRKEQETVTRSLAFEAVLGQAGDIMDVRLEYLNHRAVEKNSLRTALTLAHGRFIDLSTGDGKTPMRITGEFIR